ncbi:MAG: S-methyl-5-thioribose-1-phosphate isomerase [Armatimonadetes bacterium]|nr:S-methyl-5-thioribose-1-phosphate isomerase [Armatimonadota bacterium]
MNVRALRWDRMGLEIVDQTRLPSEFRLLRLTDPQAVVEAIQALRVRGAPAIGAAGAYGVALAARSLAGEQKSRFFDGVLVAAAAIRGARPTAVNLAWAVDRVVAKIDREMEPAAVAAMLLAEAHAIVREDEEACARIAGLGAAGIAPGERILTVCNTGALATTGAGTAFGILRAAHDIHRDIHVFVAETRPLLQGARLTAWELQQAGIPFQIVTDNAAGWLMAQGKVDRVVAGADRIAANGDTANKIGTYSLAVLAAHHRVPLWIAAPRSTIDLSTPNGHAIPIEERDPNEVTWFGGAVIAPAGAPALNFAFDVTPGTLIAAIITDAGIAEPPYAESVPRLFSAG